jgi:hypothetical protein
MESAAAFVWTNGGVILDTETTIDTHFRLIIHPWNTEDDDTLGFKKLLEDGDILWILFENNSERFNNFTDSLTEFNILSITLLKDC